MAKAVYTTVDGDRLDQICAIHYAGRQKRVVEAVFDANPHLVSLGVYYDASCQHRQTNEKPLYRYSRLTSP